MAVTAEQQQVLNQVKPFVDESARDANLMSQAIQVLGFDVNLQRPPAYWIYIYNIAPIEHIRHRPPQYSAIRISACPPDKEYIRALPIPDVVNHKWPNPDTGQLTYYGERAERFATDLINPSNLSNDMWAEVNPENQWIDGGTDDLSKRGVFWSRNEVPTKEELKKSKTRMERHYRELFQRAEDLARSGKAVEIGREHHIAADYLHMGSSWHVVTAVPEACPNCGEPIKPGIAYHPSAVGGICILDWKRTCAAGLKTKADVPEESRWWTEPPKPEIPKGK